MNGTVFTAAAVARHFGATVALERVDLSLRAGEAVALMGANGAGKSTFVKIVSGVLSADAGALTLRGKPYAPASPQAAKRAGVATVHQSVADAVAPTLSIADNLLLDALCDPLARWLAAPAARLRAAAPLARRVGLSADLRAPLGSLPLAAQQLVVIARALAGRPALLILDEPTASLSAPEAERLFALLDTLRAEGVAILLVSHRSGDLKRLADRIAILRDGRIVSTLTPPFDLDAAVDTMIGRTLSRDAARRAGAHRIADETGVDVGAAGDGFRARGVRVYAHSTPFDLDVRRGEIVAIAGPVGGGKSRFAHAIFGAAPLAAGAMTLDGARWHPRSPAAAIRGRVFLAGEDRWRASLFPDSVPFATLAGTLSLPFLSRWFPSGFVRPRRERRAAREAIARFGIRCDGPDDRLSRLSGGNQQKAVIARWHLEPARLLLLDEPFQGIDMGARADLIALLRRDAGERATLVFVSDLEEAYALADRVVHFDRGAPEPAAPHALAAP
ncbi:sugar ABC transporter ATP-binding protein [Burkholderia alba]|uniref:sugar ABC transporter ATP-binding protein n=1 Tax=Burkholderia alba TaxID=2683677 RepID=UPI002B05D3FC|nr:sugar ABC transporter ATP-binding protein [Burkholderia alba]